MSLTTVAIANAKGGVLKTTLTTALAVRATKESAMVAMFDLNSDQGNLTQWWTVRGEPMNPRLIYDLENIPADAREAERNGFEWLFIDTPPLEMDLIEQSIAIADLVIIPVRTSMFDVSTIEPVVAMCRRHRKEFAFLLAAIDSRFKSLLPQTIAALRTDGPILENQISYRIAYVQAVTVGKTGAEINKELAGEVDALWQEVRGLAASAKAAHAALIRRRAADV